MRTSSSTEGTGRDANGHNSRNPHGGKRFDEHVIRRTSFLRELSISVVRETQRDKKSPAAHLLMQCVIRAAVVADQISDNGRSCRAMLHRS
jgi:hypothetical protein